MSHRINITVSAELYQRLRELAQGASVSATAARLLADAVSPPEQPLPPQDNNWGGDRKSENAKGEGTA